MKKDNTLSSRILLIILCSINEFFEADKHKVPTYYKTTANKRSRDPPSDACQNLI